jgi:hypothetical protein
MPDYPPRHPATLPPSDSILATVRQLAEQQPALSVGSIRWCIFNAATNGLDKSGALVRVGRRVLLDPALFMAWLRTNPPLSPPRQVATKPSPRPYRPKPVAILSDRGLAA